MLNQEVKERSKATWGASPAGTAFAQGHEKGTKEFFEAVLQKRFSYECDWLDEIVDFKRCAGKKVLEIGSGAGYDAYQFCKNGADYTGIDITPDNPVIARKHLNYYGYTPTFLEMDIEHAPFKEAFDYVYSFGVLHHVPDIHRALDNVYQALKPGGEVQIIVYHKNSIFYWLHVVLGDWILRGKFVSMSLNERLSNIEYTTAAQKPLVRVYSKREIQHVMKKAGFSIIKTDVRKLVIEEFPNIPLVRAGYRFIPQGLLLWLSRYVGWYVSVKAIKPLR